MKKFRSIISILTCTAAVLAAAPLTANATDDVIYGTMNIPYADFYKAEVGGAYEVDAVSSATASKWSQNNTGSIDPETGKWKNGGLVAGTYNDGEGTILGVNYPVAISSADEAFFTENYGFVKSDSSYPAYKKVTISGGSIEVSAVTDAEPETASGSVTVSTPSGYGDVQFSVKGYPENCDIYGVLFKTAEGDVYAMRHLENIWRNGSFSWSVGVKTTESHGNTLQYEDFASSQGQTITEVKFITLDGYTTLTGINAYVPVVVDASASVENGNAGTGKTTFTTTGLPADYAVSGTVKDNFTVSGSTISYTNATPGSYKLTISDANGKYSSLTASFELTTEDIPVVFEDGKLVAAKGFTDEDAANFIKNIKSVTVNGKAYNTGKRGTTVIKSDGTVDMSAKSGETAVFDDSGSYTLSIAATGYNNPYDFEIMAEEAATEAAEPGEPASDVTTDETAETTTVPADESDDATTASVGTTTESPASSSASTSASASTTKAAASSSDSPKTGVAGMGVPFAVLALAGTTAFVLRKKND